MSTRVSVLRPWLIPVCRCDLVRRRPRKSRPWCGAREPTFESHRADSPGGAGGNQRLIVQFSAEIARVNIGRDLTRVVLVTQNATDQLVQAKFLGARDLERAIERWAEYEVSQGGDDIVREDRFYQGRGHPNGLSVTERISGAAHELEELRRAQNRVGNSRSLDKAFLSHLCAKVAAVRQPVRPDHRECDVMAHAGSGFRGQQIAA